ncbi:MAG: cysteine hydrolase [Verrucomicrobia bacterium]|nr:cysteine hydrolase [Verrucomicrobiota bacterium]
MSPRRLLRRAVRVALATVSLGVTLATGMAADSSITMHLRQQRVDLHGKTQTSRRTAQWDPRQTAVIVCDMWDDHWCRSAARRVGEMAGPLNELLKQARKQGIFVIHAPSSVTRFYEGTLQRKRAQSAPFAKTPVPLATAPRWGTAWCWTDARHEGVLPIDDTDMGCSCSGTKCTVREAWTRQIPAIELCPEDALTDDGQETWNLLAQHGIRHVILCGVHLNMCVLGRPFAIRQMVYLGQDVVLMRDFTDTMYNPERPPGVDHFTGTDLVVGHVERFWCPSIVSTDLTDRPPFRFTEDRRDRVSR